MTSDLITYLTAERVTELERAHATQLEQERAEAQVALQRAEAQVAVAALAGTVGGIVIARFPNTPAALVAGIEEIRDIEQLQALRASVLRAPDQASVEQLLKRD
jgi:hypothetical protein